MLYIYIITNDTKQCAVNTVSQKNDTTQPPTIILTVVVRFQQFFVQMLMCEYSIDGGLNSHLTCLVYLPYLAKF